MNPGAKTHGTEADPLRYPWFKYECFLMSGLRDILTKRNFNQKLWGKFYERDEK